MASGTINNVPTKTGSATYDSTYFDSPVYNFYEQYGNIVHFYFLAKIKAQIPNNVVVVNDLPRVVNGRIIKTGFVEDQYGNGVSYVRGGSLTNTSDHGCIVQYTVLSAYVGKYMLYDVVYLTK